MPDVEVLQVQAAKERKCGERGGGRKEDRTPQKRTNRAKGDSLDKD